jgi:hypothetical protein
MNCARGNSRKRIYEHAWVSCSGGHFAGRRWFAFSTPWRLRAPDILQGIVHHLKSSDGFETQAVLWGGRACLMPEKEQWGMEGKKLLLQFAFSSL